MAVSVRSMRVAAALSARRAHAVGGRYSVSSSLALRQVAGPVVPQAAGVATRLASSASAGGASAAKHNDGPESFAKRLFYGDVAESQVFPFPCALTEEEKSVLSELVQPVRRFFEEKVDSTKIDLEHHIPDEIMSGLAELGLFGLQIPESLGGLGLSNTAYARVVEELVQDAGIAVTLMAHQSIGLKGILLVGNEEQKRKYLPKLASGEHTAAFCLTEPSTGSDAAAVKTRAVPSADGSHFVLNGGKMWISNGGIAEVFTVFAQTPMPDGKDRITAFIVERSFGGITSGRPETKLGIRGSNTTTLTFEDCKVPRENVLGEVGGGFKVAMQILNNGRFGMGAGTAGGMKRMLSMASEYANSRIAFGQPLKNFGLIQKKFAEIAVKTYAIESMSYITTALIDGPKLNCAVEAAMCKVYGSEAMWEAVNECLQVMGGMGFMAGQGALPYERILRDTRILLIFEGTNEILRLFIALTGLQGRGAQLKELASKLKSNPLGNLGALLPEITSRVSTKLGQGGQQLSKVHSSLASEGKQLSQLTAEFGLATETLLRAHGKAITEEQLQLARVANIAIDLFAMSAVLSRASTAAFNKADTAAHEAKLAKALCLQASARIKENLAGINHPSSNGDSLTKDIARDVLSSGRYLPVHPLGQ